MQEYYIRKEGDEDSRGPFTLEQLSSLVEAGQVDRKTFYYDANTEKWTEVQTNAELVATLFPVKKKLSVRPKENIRTINVSPNPQDKPITVEQMLAAAEGRTDETHARRDLSGELARNAMWGLRAMAFILLASAAGLLVSNMEVLGRMELVPIVTSPLILLGVLDLLLALLLLLEITSVYNLVRIRASIGVGFFAFYFLTLGEYRPFGAVVCASIALFALTMTSNVGAVLALGALGLAGMGGFAYFMLN